MYFAPSIFEDFRMVCCVMPTRQNCWSLNKGANSRTVPWNTVDKGLCVLLSECIQLKPIPETISGQSKCGGVDQCEITGKCLNSLYNAYFQYSSKDKVHSNGLLFSFWIRLRNFSTKPKDGATLFVCFGKGGKFQKKSKKRKMKNQIVMMRSEPSSIGQGEFKVISTTLKVVQTKSIIL